MLRIITYNNCLSERRYIIDVIFNEFLGLDYELSYSDKKNTIIKFEDKSIIINDAFWTVTGEDYISTDNFPTVFFAKNDYCIEKDIPILYGSQHIAKVGKNIECGIDIFASIFFMLTRWEEIANKSRDRFGRFAAVDSIAYKYKFLDRPIVNEYVEMLWNMMKGLGFADKRKETSFEIVPTHDIDYIWPKSYIWNSIKRVGVHILRERRVDKAMRAIGQMITCTPKKNIRWIMSCSEKANLKSRFYFMAASPNNTTADPCNDNYLQDRVFHEIIKEIKSRGHFIGFHPSTATAADSELWKKEIGNLRQASQERIEEGRQHALMWLNPQTLEIWESCNMVLDSTLGYADCAGYRCGTGSQFALFNVLKRKVCRLRELPLIIMECSLSRYQGLNRKEIMATFKHYFEQGIKYKMPITILLHNGSLSNDADVNWKRIYKNSITSYS